jgi:hypothetical protein
MPLIDRPCSLPKLVGFATLIAAVTTTPGAWSQTVSDGTKACLDAYGSAQEFRKNNDLIKARQALWTCAGATCPAIIQGDCTAWLNQVVDAIPSVVLEAKRDDDNVFDVSVSMDGAPLVHQLDGKPVEINPGLHSFVFERQGVAPIEKKVIIAAHAKSQVISAEWKSPPPPQPPVSGTAPSPAPNASAQSVRPIPPLAFVLGGTAVVGLGTFAVLGLTGNTTKNDLQSSCSPHCADGDVKSLEARFVVADVALGVGALAAVGAVTVFLVRPERSVPGHAVTAVGIAPTPGGASLQWRGAF